MFLGKRASKCNLNKEQARALVLAMNCVIINKEKHTKNREILENHKYTRTNEKQTAHSVPSTTVECSYECSCHPKTCFRIDERPILIESFLCRLSITSSRTGYTNWLPYGNSIKLSCCDFIYFQILRKTNPKQKTKRWKTTTNARFGKWKSEYVYERWEKIHFVSNDHIINSHLPSDRECCCCWWKLFFSPFTFPVQFGPASR